MFARLLRLAILNTSRPTSHGCEMAVQFTVLQRIIELLAASITCDFTGLAVETLRDLDDFQFGKLCCQLREHYLAQSAK